MYNDSFFPTPPEIVDLMLRNFSPAELFRRDILEPGAGDGAICDGVNRAVKGVYNSFSFKDVHCCEIVPELQATLRGKGYTIVDSDFLEFYPSNYYDLILMNPPFQEGELHLIHAWEILEHGDIVCLQAERAITRPSSPERKLLAKLIEDHGSVVELGRCFLSAVRKNPIKVVKIHLTKKGKGLLFSIPKELSEDESVLDVGQSHFGGQVAMNDPIPGLVNAYNRALDVYKQITPLRAELSHYQSYFSDTSGSTWSSESAIERRSRDHNAFVAELKRKAWASVLRLTKVRDFLTFKVREDFDNQKDRLEVLEFNERNIREILHSLRESGPELWKQCVMDAFDIMSRYHKKNRVHVEGWKTNSAHMVNRRIVLPYGFKPWFTEPFFTSPGSILLDDIDMAFAHLEGKKLNEIETIIESSAQLKGLDYKWGVPFESTYFKCKCYEKGTIHLLIKDKFLWERFNLVAADGKNWLPDDYMAREREEMKKSKLSIYS